MKTALANRVPLAHHILRSVVRGAFILGVLAITACGGAKPMSDKRGGAVDHGTNTPVEAAPDERSQVMRLFMEATQARLGGQMLKAVALYQQCLKLNPTNGAAHFELAKLHHQGQNFPAAVDHAKRAVAADKENIWYRFLLADLYNRLGDQAESDRYARMGQEAAAAAGRK